MNMKNAIIVDIDGTLADCEHRRHHVTAKPKDWKKFFDAMTEDGLVTSVAKVVSLLAPEHDVLLVTGRSEEYRHQTLAWLSRHLVGFDRLLMRPVNDQRPDDIVKLEIYEREIKGNYNVLFVLDDRAKVVAMWRAQGLPCWQVCKGDF